MNTKTLLALLFYGVCFGCNSPKSESDLTKSNKNMTNVELREKLVKALDDMKSKAIEMGIQGVATASVLNNGETDDWIGEMKVVGTPTNISGKQEADTTTTLKAMVTPLKKEQFIQVTIVVNDIRKAAKAWAFLLNVPEPEIWTNHLESNAEYPYTYRGQDDKPCNLQMCVIDMGNWVLELHQIDENPSTFREFINKHGQGVHHLGFEVGDARDEVIRELKEMGFDTERTIGVYPGSSWTIVDSEDVLGVNLNIKPKR